MEQSLGNKPIVFRSKYNFSTYHNAFVSLGMNTGNMVFLEALKKLLDVQEMTFDEYIKRQDEFPDNKIVTTDLIWITQNGNFDYLAKQLDQMKYQSMIPISIGVQASSFDQDFVLNKSAKEVLARLQDRGVLGVRGEYTASVLYKNGIKNFEIIGCPSMYYWNRADFKLLKKSATPQKVTANFRTFYGLLSIPEKHFLTYCANRKFSFVEQTEHRFSPKNANDDKYFAYVNHWIEDNNNVFFNINDWMKYMKGFDFSIGGRFHGNILALWNGIPALFCLVDARTEEMVRWFHLPYIKMSEFDDRKSIDEYYDLADYTEFNRHYEERYEGFRNFLKKAGLDMNNDKL